MPSWGMLSSTRLLIAVCTQAAFVLCRSYTPPTPKCKPFTCPAGKKPVRKKGHKPWSYGCKDAGGNIFSVGKNFDPNDPLGSLNNNKRNFDKCCIEHDACQQTCGMTSADCHNGFQKCATKICKGDENCMFQAQIGQMMSGPGFDEIDKSSDKDRDPTCRAYDSWQGGGCECEDKEKWEDTNDKRLKTFYKLYNPEKLDDKGDIKDLVEVKKKWKGKEPQMFLALTMKYKDKAIERREKPKPPPYSPPPPKDDADGASGGSEDSYADEGTAEDEGSVEAGSATETKIANLKIEKAQAVENEDFEKAQQIKETIESLTKEEVDRLKKEKDAAVAEEDFLKAKQLKARIEKLEL